MGEAKRRGSLNKKRALQKKYQFITFSDIKTDNFNPIYSEDELECLIQSEHFRYLKEIDDSYQVSRLLARQLIAAENYPQICLEQKIIIELLKFSINDRTRGDNRSPYCGQNLEQVRSIGEKLNKLGGFDLMHLAGDLVPIYDQRNLDHAWNGIGDWKA
ncbi:hypothetical protein [Anabaena sp. CCY 0017]|uniref:hypothetical protein n=1 Tax=Anabaena sp. CCY 0017 TaxID=3103866 RepID=UPI0039C69AB9